MVMCSIIAAWLLINGEIVMDDVVLKGKVNSKSSVIYYINFTENAKTKNLIGDYSDVMVPAEKCVRL